MKILALGDTHGRTDWMKLLDEDLSQYKRIIFIGDYFDTHADISQDEQIENFKKILTFKQVQDNVILLIGNHDYHYMGDFKITYSGFDATRAFDIREILNKALKDGLIQMSHLEYTDSIPVMFTHAGVTKTWLSKNIPDWNLQNVSDKINELFKYKPGLFEFTPGDNYNPYGDEVCQTPIWVRPNSLMSDGFSDNVVQVAGHTQQSRIKQIGKFIFIDALESCPGDFLVLTDNDEESRLSA